MGRYLNENKFAVNKLNARMVHSYDRWEGFKVT